MKLDRRNLRKLGVGESASAGGVTYTRLPGGDGRWSINVMVNRVRHHQVVGLESEGYTLTQAQELVLSLKAKKREGDHGIVAPKHRARLTVSAASADYLTYLAGHGGRDIERKKVRFSLHINRLIGSVPIARLSDTVWDSYVAKRRGEGASNGTINREGAAFAHMLRTMVKRRLLVSMPLNVQRQAESAGRLVYLNPEQFQRLTAAAAQDQSPLSLPFVMIAGHTGMRQEPILNLRARDVDLERRILWVDKDKAGEREQPIPGALVAYLREYIRDMAPDDWLFPSSRAASGRTYQFNSQFARCVRRAGLGPEVTPHTMRHTMGSNAAHAGIDAATIQAMGGWKTRQMVERYTHAANLMSAMDVLEAKLAGPVTPKLHTRPSIPA